MPSTKGLKSALNGALNGLMPGVGKTAGLSLGKALTGGMATAIKAGAAAISAATGAIVAFGGASVRAGMDFDSAISQVAATMGTTVDQIQDLRDYAQQMGSTTAFSATESAEALNYMALAGYDAETSMKMLPNVLNLAAAGAMDLGAASDMITDSQSALGLSLEETTELVDKMAQAASKSNTSVAQLGDAILTIGGTAKNLKGGTTELATALGILADNGIKGAEGGTMLRNVLLGLQSDKFATNFGELGVSLYDAAGNMRELKDVFSDMNKVMSGMNVQEKNELISSAFNRYDLSAVNALLATTGERWNELTGAIGNAEGAAEKMAETQLDNLAGDITLFKSALEGAQIAISDQLSPSLREFVQFGTDGLARLTTAFKEGGVDGAIAVFGELVDEGIDMIMDGLPKAIEAGGKLLLAIGKGIADNLPKLASAATDLLHKLADYLVEAMPEIAAAIPVIIKGIVKFIIDNLPALGEAAFAIIGAILMGLLELTADLLKAGVEIVKSIGLGIKQQVGEIGTRIAEIGAKIKEGIQNIIDQAKTWGWDLITNFIKGITSKLGDLWDTIKGVGEGIFGYWGHSHPQKGPLADDYKWMPDMMDLMAGGIRDYAHLPLRETENLAKKIEATLGLDKTVPVTGAVAYAQAVPKAVSLEPMMSSAFRPGYADQYIQQTMRREPKVLNINFEMDKHSLGRAVYELYEEENQRVGVKLAKSYR